MENIYIVFIEYDNNVAKISPIKCSFTEIIKNSIKSLKNIYFYNESKISTIKSSDILLKIIDNKNREIENRDSVIISSPTISFIIITSNNTQYYVIGCDIKSHDRLITPINKNITNLISNLILNINHKKETITLNGQQLRREPNVLITRPVNQARPKVLITRPVNQKTPDVVKLKVMQLNVGMNGQELG
jgi:hypothetical protein